MYGTYWYKSPLNERLSSYLISHHQYAYRLGASIVAHLWQHTAAHCNTLQHTATHCNTLQYTATHCNKRNTPQTHCNTLQHTAAHCNILQHTATHCNTLQHTAAHCNTLQHTATHCNTLQHTATHCNTPNHRRDVSWRRLQDAATSAPTPQAHVHTKRAPHHHQKAPSPTHARATEHDSTPA